MKYLATLLAAILISCEPPNGLPISTIDIPDQLVPHDGLELDLEQYFLDPEGGPLTYDAMSEDPSKIRTEVSAAILALTSLEIGLWPVMITVTATDSEGASATSVFTASGNTVFYESWDSPDALDEWSLEEQPTIQSGGYGPAHAEVEDGNLYLYTTSNVRGGLNSGITAKRTIPTVAKNWSFTARTAVSSRNLKANACMSMHVHSNDPKYESMFMLYDGTGIWTLLFAAEIGHMYFQPYWFALNYDEFYEDWDGAAVNEFVEFTFSLIDGIIEIHHGDIEVASFDPLTLETEYYEGDQLGWPPDEYPADAVAIEVGVFWGCGGREVYAPGGGNDREDRNNIAIDWIRFEQMKGS